MLNFGFSLTETQEMIWDAAKNIAELADQTAHERDVEGRFCEGELKALAELGFMGIKVPESDGGTGADMVSYSLAVAAVSKGCASVGVTLSVCNLVADVLSKFGNEEQKAKWLAPYLKGELGAGAFCLSEAHCGSDAAALKTKATLDGDEYVLNGSKQWITNGGYSGVFIVFALTGPKEISAFIVGKDVPGFVVGKKERKMGIRSSNTVPLTFEDCRVPASQLLGKVGDGYRIAMSGLDGGRVGIAAQSIGIGERALEEGIKYGRERQAFGKSVLEFQNSQFAIADSRSELDQSWLLTLRAAKELDQKGKARKFSSMAKLMASETCVRVADRMLQLHGGYGYVEEYPIERIYRDARITRIYEGTSEVQRIVIAREVLA